MRTAPAAGVERSSRGPELGTSRAGPGLGVRGFIALDVRGSFEEVSELVDPVHEALLGEGIDLEARRRVAGERHGLGGEVDGNPDAGVGVARLDQARMEGRV